MSHDTHSRGGARRQPLSSASLNGLADRFAATAPAVSLPPIPPGEYPARILSAETERNRDGSLRLVLTISIMTPGGPRTLPWRLWLSDEAIALTKRDLLAIGVSDLRQLDRRPLPPVELVALVARRYADDGREYAVIRRAWATTADPAADAAAWQPATPAAATIADDVDPFASPPVATPVATATAKPQRRVRR